MPPVGVALAKYIEEVKTGSTHWIRKKKIFPDWPGWQDGYAALTLAHKGKDGVIEYIKDQEEHHRRTTFMEEYRRLLEEAGVEYDPEYLE